MTVLIIDDDKSMIEMLRETLDWKKLEIENVLSAQNISAAKQIFLRQPVDIMICDIEMPGGSGIDLLTWVREQGYETRNIFLTNHTKFHYAQTAIKLDTVDFIGKMSPPQELEDALRRAVNIVKTVQVQKRYVDYGRYWEENNALLWRQFWLDLIDEKIPPDPEAIGKAAKDRLLEWYGTDQGKSRVTNFLPLLCTVQLSQETIADWKPGELDYCVYNVVSEVLFGSTNSDHIVPLGRESRALYAVILDESDPADIQKKARELVSLFRQYLMFGVNIYLTENVPIEQISFAIRKLKEADRNNVTEQGGVHTVSLGQKEDSGEKGHKRIDMDNLSSLLASGQAFKAINEVKKYFSGLPRSQIDAQLLQEFHYDFTQVLYAVLSERHIEAHELFAKPAAQALDHHAAGSLIDMMKWVSFASNAVTQAISDVSRSNTIVGTVKAYIEDNYASHITKADFGALVFLNPDYLAKVFKKETGIALGDYISSVRVEKAKVMLADESISLGDVAMKAGFDYYSYFSTIFKKQVGISPSDYRRQLLEHGS